MKKTVLRTYKSGSEAKGYDRGVTVYQCMHANAQFADEQPLVDVLQTKRLAYEAAKGAAANRDSLKVAIKNDCYAAFIDQLDLVADAVEMKAQGDVKIAQAAGFETVSTTQRSIDFLNMPTGLKAEDVRNRKGFIKVSRDNDPDAVSTVVECLVLGGEGDWQNMANSTANTVSISGLPSGKYVSVRIYSTGRKGLRSDTTTDVVTVLVS